MRDAAERIGGPVRRPADGARRRRAARRRSSRIPSSARSSRSAPAACFAELIGEAGVPDRAAHRRRRRGARRRAARPAGSSRGFRGAPPADADALADLVLRLGRLGDDLPGVAELDLNPVLARPDGCVAVDARVRVSPARAGRSARRPGERRRRRARGLRGRRAATAAATGLGALPFLVRRARARPGWRSPTRWRPARWSVPASASSGRPRPTRLDGPRSAPCSASRRWP